MSSSSRLRCLGVVLGGGWFGRDLVAAFLVGTLPAGAFALAYFFHQVSRAAFGARLRNDAIPTGKFAFRVAAAAKEDFAAPAAPFQHLTFLAFRAVDAGLHGLGPELLDAVAFGIA